MNISGIRIQAGFYDYNTIKNTQIQEESVPNVIDTAGEDTRVAEVTESERDNKPDHGATEYAKQYQPDAEYDLKGIASDITSLDVESYLRYEEGSGVTAVSVFCWRAYEPDRIIIYSSE